jgi:membrane protein DedA with SNARE-associated domain
MTTRRTVDSTPLDRTVRRLHERGGVRFFLQRRRAFCTQRSFSSLWAVTQDGFLPWSVVTEFLTTTIDRLGEAGVGVLIFLENVVPPIPSEAILPLAGYRASEGAMNLLMLWIAATLGSLAGALVLYAIGRLLGYERLHAVAGSRWFVLCNRHDLERARNMFDRHGSKIVLLARFIPLLRSAVSVPAGIAAMPVPRFVTLTAIGSGIWNAVFIGLGWTLGDNWPAVDAAMGPAGYVVAGGVLVGAATLAYRKLKDIGISSTNESRTFEGA